MTAPRIRRAQPTDLAAVVELLRDREGRVSGAGLERAVEELDPSRAWSWAAFQGDEALGLTTAFHRWLHVDGQRLRAAYWGNMYIRPDQRDRMLYPRLPLAMFQGLKQGGVALLYSAIRRERFAKANLKIGCHRIGWLPVLAKPIRPAAFLARYRNLGVSAGKLGAPMDVLSGAWLRLAQASRPGRSVRPLTSDADFACLVDLLETHRQGRIGRAWSTKALARRYAVSWDGSPYHVLGTWKGRTLKAAAIFRLAEREAGIVAGVLMDLVLAPGAFADGWRVLAAAEWAAYQEGGQVMLHLDGLGRDVSWLTRFTGYLPTGETYMLLAWPGKALEAYPSLKSLPAWRFGFGDHDAF